MKKWVVSLFFGLAFSAGLFGQGTKENFRLDQRIEFGEDIFHAMPLNNGTQLLLIGKNKLQLWDVSNSKLIREVSHEIDGLAPRGMLAGITWSVGLYMPVSVSPDGSILLVIQKGDKKSETGVVWDLRTGKQVAVFERSATPTRTVNFSKDGGTVITTHGDLKDMEIAIWNLDKFEYRSSIRVQDLAWHHLTGDGKLLFTRSGKARKWLSYLVTGFAESSTVDVWDTQNGTKIQSFSARSFLFSGDGREPTISGDDKYLVARTGNRIVVWETDGNGAPKYEIADDYAKKERTIRKIEIGNDARYFINFNPDGAGIYEIENGELHKRFGIRDGFHSITPDYKYAMSRSLGSASIYEIDADKVVSTLNFRTVQPSSEPGDSGYNTERAMFSSDGRFVMQYGDNRVKIFETKTGELLHTGFDPQNVKYKKNREIRDNGLNNSMADWLSEGNSFFVLGKERKSVLIFDFVGN